MGLNSMCVYVYLVWNEIGFEASNKIVHDTLHTMPQGQSTQPNYTQNKYDHIFALAFD